ncbi:MAG: hypothetical protein ACOYXB_10975 [Bacteroidota bacterium]
MKDNENLLDKIKEMFGTNPGTFNIMEEQIDIDLQMDYFEASRRIASEVDEFWAMDQAKNLIEDDYPLEVKKRILARLASMEKVEAYRVIENYLKVADPEIRDWTQLALQESRMHLESQLLEENQIFISTGLGGKEHKLRYFVVLIARSRKILSEVQQKVIKSEFAFILKKYDAEIEEIEFSDYLATILLLLPINYPIKQVFTEAIEECNQYGDFLRDHFIVTNVKKLTFKEIRDFIERKKKKSSKNSASPASGSHEDMVE